MGFIYTWYNPSKLTIESKFVLYNYIWSSSNW